MRGSGLCSALFILVGCSDDPIKHLPDGPPAIDAPIGAPDAPSAAVTVTTLARCCTELPGTPQAAVPVAVIQPDGSLGEMAVTGADGKVTFHDVRSGATITAFYPENATFETTYVTMAGVKPGDDLTFGDHYYQPPLTTGTPGTATLSYPAFANAVHYQMYTTCGFFTSDTLS
ncbi:MAG: hypothetical protein NT062_17950, partial [Proteobacteria bacterium]|nr:hypothetical protein [Pseudomonadota bacterium]